MHRFRLRLLWQVNSKALRIEAAQKAWLETAAIRAEAVCDLFVAWYGWLNRPS